MISILLMFQAISFMMIIHLYNESIQKDKQITCLFAILHKRFGITIKETAENLIEYIENNINMEE